MTLEWSKIKNIVILMLVAVNAFLLVLVSVRNWRSVQYDRQVREQAVEILAQNGIRLSLDALPPDEDLPTLELTRDPDSDSRQAQALLGALTQEPGSSVYRGEKGAARFYLNGEFSAEFTPGAYAVRSAGELLSAMGIESEVLEQTAQAVTLRQTWQGAPIFNCRVTFTAEGDSLTAVADRSRRASGTAQPRAGQESMTAVTALMRFLDYTKSSADLCSSIDRATLGYTLDSQSDPARLIPTWRLTTDNGAYDINALTGEVKPEQ